MFELIGSQSKSAGFPLFSVKVLSLTAALLISACATTAGEDEEAVELTSVIVELYEPEPLVAAPVVPSIDITEYERQQAELAAAEQRVLDNVAAAERAEIEAEIEAAEAAEAAAEVAAIERRKARARRKAEASKTPLDRAAETDDPNAKIEFLKDAEDSDEVQLARLQAYRSKLMADKENANAEGQAIALIYLGDADRSSGARASKLKALRQYAEAQEVDPANIDAPERISTIRGELQSYADELHKEAVALFVAQDFAPAISRWKTVLLIDPGNAAARNWFNQSRAAIGS